MSAEDTKMGRKNSRESRTTEKDDEKVWKSFPPCARIRRFEKILAHPPPPERKRRKREKWGKLARIFLETSCATLRDPFYTHTY